MNENQLRFSNLAITVYDNVAITNTNQDITFLKRKTLRMKSKVKRAAQINIMADTAA